MAIPEIYADRLRAKRRRDLAFLELSMARRWDRLFYGANCSQVLERRYLQEELTLSLMRMNINATYGKFACDPMILYRGFNVPLAVCDNLAMQGNVHAIYEKRL